MKPVGIAVVGAGYWGPNLIRNFRATPAAILRWVCDIDVERAQRALGAQTDIRATDDLAAVLDDPGVEGVALATPAGTHFDLGMMCLAAGKHLLVEKPLAPDIGAGRKLIEEAARLGLTVMCDHTYCYTSPVIEIRDLIATHALGDIQYVDSVRINLGLVQSDIDVFWDLAPHDLSILDFILPEDIEVVSISAQAADPIGVGHACVGYAAIQLSNGAMAHVNVNWLSPTKIRRTIIGGSKQMIVWDDLRPGQRLSIYDTGVELSDPADSDERRDRLVSYRVGTMHAPAIREVEALRRVVDEFAASIREQRAPVTDGRAGLRVLAALSAIDQSVALDGAAVPVDVTV